MRATIKALTVAEAEIERLLTVIETIDKAKELRRAWWTIDKQETEIERLGLLLHYASGAIGWPCSVDCKHSDDCDMVRHLRELIAEHEPADGSE